MPRAQDALERPTYSLLHELVGGFEEAFVLVVGDLVDPAVHLGGEFLGILFDVRRGWLRRLRRLVVLLRLVFLLFDWRRRDLEAFGLRAIEGGTQRDIVLFILHP